MKNSKLPMTFVAALLRTRMVPVPFPFLIFNFAFLIGAVICGAQTNQPPPVASAVMVNSNGVVIAPANFAAANGFGTNNGGGLASNLAPAKIYIGNALSNAAAQTLSGDLTLSTNGAAALAATGTAGTYAQATFDSKGRETSGATVLPLNAGGTGQTTASAALTALGTSGGTIVGVVIQPANGTTAPYILFPPTTSQTADQAFTLAGSPYTSGASVSFQLKMTNAVGSPDANGYYTWDPIAFQMMVPGMEATNVDGPGWALIVANSMEPIVLAHPQGSSGNLPGLYLSGDTNGFFAEIPYNDGISNHIQPLPLDYFGGASNLLHIPVSAKKLFEVDQNHAKVVIYNPASGGLVLANGATLTTTNGVVFGPNGKLMNAVAFDANDTTNGVYFGSFTGVPAYVVTSPASITNGIWDANGPGNTGFNMAGGGSVALVSGTSRQFWLDANGIYPVSARSGLLNLGLNPTLEWGQVWTKAIMTTGTSSGTITATGWTNATGTNCYVSVIGSSVSFVVHDAAGTAWATNTSSAGGSIIPLQIAGSITAASGLSGTWHVQ